MIPFLVDFMRNQLEKDIRFTEFLLAHFDKWLKWLLLAFLICSFTPLQSAQAASGIAAVWANEGGDKVTRDDLRVSQGGKNVTNSVWDGTTIQVFGAKNEVVNFNVVLESLSGAGNVSVSFSKLTGPGGSTIASVPATGNQVFNYVNRNIELFYVRYLPIHGLSLVSYGNYDERQVPQRLRRPWSGAGYGTGAWQDRPDHDKYYPDIAVPLELVPTFSIVSGQNQSIWADIYIPKSASPGLYTGNLVIQENGATTHTLPVQLKVYNFALPDTPSAKTMVYYSDTDINKRYLGSSYIDPTSANGAKAQLLRDRHFLLAHRHRMSLIADTADDCSAPGDQPCPEWGPRLSGALFTAANGYDGPGVGTGNNVYSIGTYGTWNWKSGGQTAMNQHADAWVNWFTQNAAGTEYFLYVSDESPNTAQTQTWAQSILSDPGPGQQLRSMATIALPTAAANTPSLDIVASTIWQGIPTQWQPLADQYTADARKRFYVYNGHRPASGSFATDDDGVALREMAWVQYKKNINRWYFWESTYYNNYQGGMGETNVFENAQTFGTSSKTDPVVGQTGWNYANGDGVLMYPGTDQVYPADSYGVDGPLASLRLKTWRRGLQDVDYLTLASAINPAAVQVIVSSMVPKALWEYGVTDPNDPTWVRTDISWPINPDTWEAARQQLANIIAPGF